MPIAVVVRNEQGTNLLSLHEVAAYVPPPLPTRTHASLGLVRRMEGLALATLAVCLAASCARQSDKPRCHPPYPAVGTKGRVSLSVTPLHEGGLSTQFGGRDWLIFLPADQQIATTGEAQVVAGTPLRDLRVTTVSGSVLILKLQPILCG